MIMLKIENIREFMRLLVKDSLFDDFEARTVFVSTYVSFDIDCRIKKNFFPEEKRESIKRDFCLWKEMRPVVFGLIKGERPPLGMKIVLSARPGLAAKIHENAKALFLNINFEQENLSITSGCSQKEFSLSKDTDSLWDSYIREFLTSNGILYSEE